MDAYNAAVANVNKAVDDADSSLQNATSQKPCSDLPALRSQLALLQVSFSHCFYRFVIIVFSSNYDEVAIRLQLLFDGWPVFFPSKNL